MVLIVMMPEKEEEEEDRREKKEKYPRLFQLPAPFSGALTHFPTSLISKLGRLCATLS